jgi:hypothetical protein
LCVLYWFVLAWIGVCGYPSVAAAASPVLLVVRTIDAADPAPYELRLRSELAAEGIDAVVANPNSVGADTKQLAARFGANGVIEVTVSVNELTTSVWVAEPSASLEVTRNLRVSTQQRDAVAVFALRTVDFLQGARLELEQQRRAKLAAANTASTSGPPATPAVTAQPDPEDSVRPKPARVTALGSRVAPPLTRPHARHPVAKVGTRDRFRLGLAYVLLLPSDKFGWSTAPALSMQWFSKSRWAVGTSAAGPFVNHINAGSGDYQVTVDQELVQLELRKCLNLLSAVDLEPTFGLGGSRYSAVGHASPGFAGHPATAWSMFALAGGSLVYHLGSHWHFVGDVVGFVRWQAPRVWVDGQYLTGNSRWNLLLRAGPGWSF